jgi:hypothetical protein
MEFLSPPSGEFLEAFASSLGIANRFVIDISDVSNMKSLHVSGFQNSPKNILHHEGAEIPNMCWAVNGRATAVETERFTING